MTAWIGLITCELMVPGAMSLKDKRRAVRSLIDRLHRRYRVSVAETGLQDLHQRAEISVALVSGDEAELVRMIERLRDEADEVAEAVVASWDSQVMEATD
jgi:hypothetical protein